MNNNILDVSNEKCIGCGVCSKICPNKCIEMIKSKLGFYEPSIFAKCTSCGLCKKGCYKFFDDDNTFSICNAKPYLAYSMDEILREKSSSGGIGGELAKNAIRLGYSVIGVEYDYDSSIAKDIVIDDEKELYRIVGSKYMMSYTEEAFKNININKKYVIFGTPCQIYGLRKYMEQYKLDNMILVDFFCHGATSVNLWSSYIDYVKEKHNLGKVNKINFRDKSNGWHNYTMKIEGENGVYSNGLKKDIFFNFFLLNYCLSESCGECKLRFNKLSSDIRIGDFWGKKCLDNEDGISIVLTNTKVGEELFDSLSNIHKELVTYEELKDSQGKSIFNIPKERKEVLYDLSDGVAIMKIYKKYPRKFIFRRDFKYNLTLPLRIPYRIIRDSIKDRK